MRLTNYIIFGNFTRTRKIKRRLALAATLSARIVSSAFEECGKETPSQSLSPNDHRKNAPLAHNRSGGTLFQFMNIAL